MFYTNLRQMFCAVVVTLTLTSLPGPEAVAQTPISGNLAGTLTLSSSPYIVTANSVINAGDGLTVEAGVVIKFNPSVYLTVNGTLVCNGTALSPILMTSVSGIPEPGDWMAIFAQNNSIVQLTHTWIEYAGTSGYAGIKTTSGTSAEISFDGGGIRNCLNAGMDVRAEAIDLRNLHVENNGGDGISIRPVLPSLMQNLQVNNNGGYAIRINQNPCNIQSGLSGTGNGFNGLYVTGTLGGGQPAGSWSWAANENFPVIVGQLTISGDDRLILDPGSVVKFNDTGSYMNITNGHLESLADPGSMGQSWLTSIKDDAHGGDTNGDGFSTALGGDWQSIFMQNTSSLNLQDAVVAYGGSSGYASLTTTSGTMASINWEGGGLENSAGDGCRLKSQTTYLSDLKIIGNGSDGFEINSTVPAVFSTLEINNNGAYCGRLTANPGNFDGTITGSGNGLNGVYVTGSLGGGQPAQQWNWSTSSNVPIIVGNLTITGQDTLSVNSGAVVKFNSTGSFMAFTNGALHSTGGDPAWFTSIKDDAHGGDTNHDGSATSPAPGDWQSVFMQNLSSGDLHNLWMAYGGSSGYANMTTTSGIVTDLSWDGGGLMGAGNDGARVRSNSSDLRNLTLESNVADGFEINSNIPTEFENIVALNNGGYGLRVTANPGNLPATLSGSGNGFNGINVTGALGGTSPSGVWTWSTVGEFPAIVSNITITSADTLSVTGGSTVKFVNSGSSMAFTNGTFQSTGGDPIWFTSIKDDSHGGDTNNDGSSTSPAPGDWQSIFMQNTSNIELNNTWIAYGGSSGYANVTTTSGTVTNLDWDGGGLMGSFSDGLRLRTAQASASNLTLEGNLGDGFEINSTLPPNISNFVVNNNGAYGLNLTASPGNIPVSFSGTGNGYNGILVNGSLGGAATDQQWTWSGGNNFPVIVGVVNITGSDTLSVAPAAIIKFNGPGSYLNFTGGMLKSPGGTPAWLTSIKDDAHGGDTNNDGAASIPEPGNWMSIFMQNNSRAELNNVWLAYGGSSGYANMTTTSGRMSSIDWTDGGSAFSGNDGIRITSTALDFEQLRIINNTYDGLELNTTVSAAIHNSEIAGNGLIGVRNSNTSVMMAASDNWWGHSSGPLDLIDGNPDYNPAGLGQPVSEYVDYRPWTPSAPANGAPGVFQLLLPSAGQIYQTGPVDFTWSNSVDPNGDTVVYSLEISRTVEFDDIYLTMGGLTGLAASIDASELEANHTSWWRVVARDSNFNATLADPGLRSVVQGEDLSPAPETSQFAFRVGKVWPNPASLTSSMAFNLPQNGAVRLQVFDVRGRLVRSIVDETFSAGEHIVHWDGRDRSGGRAANGLYFYRLQTDSGQRVRRLVMIR